MSSSCAVSSNWHTISAVQASLTPVGTQANTMSLRENGNPVMAEVTSFGASRCERVSGVIERLC